MRYGSVCSGIEAATAAWHPLGWEPAFFSEIEAFPRAVLAHHYPAVPLHGDFTTIKGDEYGPVDLLVGGTPCQSFSVAGLRGGLDDERGNLALGYLKLADRLRPKWLVWENVPGVLSSNGGRDFGSILGGMVELGYGLAYRVLDAQFFGVPQRRRRVFVVGHLGDWRSAAAVLFERHSLQGHSPPRREAGKGIAVCPTLRAGGNSTGGDRPPGTDVDTADSLIVARCVTASQQRLDWETETFVTHTLRAEGFDASEDGAGRRIPIVPLQSVQAVRDKKQNGIGIGAPGDQMFTLTGRDQHAVAFDLAQITSATNRTRAEPELPASTLSKGSRMHVASSAVRRLTPRECERLQGFPDDYTLIPYRGKPAADGPRYKALGNSMAVPVMSWIGQRIQAVVQMEQRRAA
jgi:DNA (cytosine-5)-methyltransferase 1